MSAEQMQDVAIERLRTATQIRKQFDPRIITAIADSLLDCGQLQPIRVRQSGDVLVIVDGELRYRAAKIAKLKTMKVIVEPNELCNGEVILRQLVSNCHRSNLNDIEKAQAIELLMKETEWNASQTAAKLGFSVGTVTKSLSLLTLSEPLQKRVCDGEIPATAAYALTQVQELSDRDALAARVVSGELTRDGLTRAIKAQKQKRRRVPCARACRVTAKLENRQSVMVSAPVLDLNAFVSILETLLGHARDAHTQGLTLGAFMKRVEGLRRTPAPARETG
jgi:ParB family chromosome partitioning protein